MTVAIPRTYESHYVVSSNDIHNFTRSVNAIWTIVTS